MEIDGESIGEVSSASWANTDVLGKWISVHTASSSLLVCLCQQMMTVSRNSV